MALDPQPTFIYGSPAMFANRRASLAVLIIAASCATSDRAMAERQDQQVVVLRNGNVLQGHVQNVNRRLVVSSRGQSRVTRVPLDDVDFVCSDMTAAYRRKLGRLEGGNVEQHIRLAHWCLKYDLRDQAVDRLLYLNQVSPHHTAVRALEKRLRRLASRPPSTSAVRVQDPSASNELPMGSGDLPAESLADFTRVVQPLLLNRCGQATCHGASSASSFRVTAGLRGTPNRERTWNNLAAVVRQINQQDYASSPLLLKARSVHGNGRRAPIGPHELKQYQRLVDWTKQLAGTPKQPPKAVAQWAPKSVSPLPRVPRPEELDPDHPFAAIFAARRKAEALQGSSTSKVDDPFDPSSYNSQFSGQR